MKKMFKHLFSFFAIFAVVMLAFGTETMAAKKSKTLKNTIKKGFVRCGVSQGLKPASLPVGVTMLIAPPSRAPPNRRALPPR